MARILDNRLLLWSLLVFIGYWTAGAILPNPILSSTSSLLLLVAGGVTAVRFGPDAYRIVVHQQRSENEDGSHLAAYGVLNLSAGSCYVGLFGLLWIWFGQPPDWLGTAISGFGRFQMATGFVLLALSPDVSRRRFRFPGGWWLAGIIAAAVLLIFFLGFQIGQREVMSTWQGVERRAANDERPVCPENKPVWVTAKGVYHTVRSPYRIQVTKPDRCYRTEREARMAGFRPPR